MSRLETPLLHRFLRTTGDLLLRGEIILAIKTNQATWEDVRFIVDSGSEITTMLASLAKQLGFPMPQQASAGVRHNQTGLEVRSGLLRVRVVGMDSTEYVVPCFFLGDPDTSLAAIPASASVPRNLLGLSGVVDKLRIIFDGDARAGAAYGHVIIEKK
jgi:hypothetical protein